MNTLNNASFTICEFRRQLEASPEEFYTHRLFEKNAITSETVSILMTSSNRSKQVSYTLQTIARSAYKNVHVILVDDSTTDPVTPVMLEPLPFSVDFITINRATKCWHNPVVNYNIGFKYIKGGYVILQNAEVCHVGDVISYLVGNVPESEYWVFDVRASKGHDANEEIYRLGTDTPAVYTNDALYMLWYQHQTNDRKFHFLAGGKRSTFDRIGGFSFDYMLGSSWDDDDYLLKIQAQKIPIRSIYHPVSGCGGIHLYHVIAGESWDRNVECNDTILKRKRDYLARHGIYIEVSDHPTEFVEYYRKLVENRA